MNARAERELPADNFPRWFLWGAGSLIAFSLISVGLVRITGNGPDQLRAAAARGEGPAPSAERALRFQDRPDGGISVIDMATKRELAVIEGEQGFVRGSLRALTRERKARELGSEQPFELIAQADGRLTLHDPATGKRVELESFGPSNAANFSRLLTLQAEGPGR
ncbi:MAG: putative photosynthetic complex assembly protein PuhC [Pseudomonadota bacterium]|jgi:putative photosynthetic complex assembly protein